MSKNKTIITIIISGLLILDTYLVYNNFKNQQTITELEKQIINLENSKYDNNGIGFINLKPIELANYDENKTKFILISLLSDGACKICLGNEIKLLNNINRNYENYLKVYYEGNSNYLKELNAEFNFQVVNNLKEKFSLPFIIDNPVSFLIDKNGYIHSFHKAINGEEELSDKYYKSVNFLFDEIYKNK